MGRRSKASYWLGLTLCMIFGCRNKLPSNSNLLNLPSSEQIGTIQARKSLLKALMAGHSHDWADSKQHFYDAHHSDPHPTIVELHTQVQQASKSLKDTTKDE